MQVRIAHLKLVSRANAPAVVKRKAAAMRLRAGNIATAVAVGGHGVDAQGCVACQLEVEVTLQALVALRADGCVDFVLGNQARLLVNLVNDAASRTPPKQHGGRAAQDFDPVNVECVAVVLGNVPHTVEVNVTGCAEAA